MREVPWFRFDVELIARHLVDGVSRKCKACPVALAVSEAVGAWRFVDVASDGRVIVKHAGRHVEARVTEPERLAEIVRLIDAGYAALVEPTRFEVWCPFPPLAEVA